VTRLKGQRGSVTIVTAGAIVITLVCTMGVADVGRVLIERSKAEMAADAAALAAAQDLALAAGDPAADAAAFADRNGARLVSCSCAPGSFDAFVTVTRSFDGLLLVSGTLDIHASARAVVDLP
jgi:secretion/DNA translocation related TadE-like protein